MHTDVPGVGFNNYKLCIRHLQLISDDAATCECFFMKLVHAFYYYV